MSDGGGRKDGNSLAKSRDYGHVTWDDNKPPKEIFTEIFRISKHQVIFGGEHLSHYLPQSRGWIFWDKDTGNNEYADGELAWTSFNKALRKFKWRWKGMFQEDMKNKEIRYHPTQKPCPLMKWIIQNYGKECQSILDPFMGSGTTGVACKELGRDFIGIEICEEYFNIAKKRIDNTQTTML
jgi:DNA modification methylase